MMLSDSNVLIAALAEDHPGHGVGIDFVLRAADRIAISADSLSEAYNTLTRHGRGYGLPAGPTAAALETLRQSVRLIGLSPLEIAEAVSLFAATGGIGPRFYDFLIGRAAVLERIDTIVTWNTSHMRALFPALHILTPDEAVT